MGTETDKDKKKVFLCHYFCMRFTVSSLCFPPNIERVKVKGNWKIKGQWKKASYYLFVLYFTGVY